MTTLTNNFDTSSTGFNIELSAFLDGFSARTDYEENIGRLDSVNSDEFIYTSFGNYSPTTFEKSWDIPSAKQLFKDYFTQRYLHGYDKATYSQIKDTLIELCEGSDDFNISTVSQIEMFNIIRENAAINGNSDEYFDELYERTYEVHTSRGYSQGDVVNVIIHPSIIEELDENYTLASVTKCIDNLLWDTPASVRMDIVEAATGETHEIYLDEYLKDIYRYEKDEIIQGFKEDANIPEALKAVALPFLVDTLSDELVYVS